MRTKLKVFSSPETSQEVEVIFEYYDIKKFFEGATYFINYIKVETPLTLFPSGIIQDLTTGIAEALGVRELDLRIECEPEFVYECVVVESKILAA